MKRYIPREKLYDEGGIITAHLLGSHPFFPRSSPVGSGSGTQDVCRYMLAGAGNEESRVNTHVVDEGICV